MPPVDLYLLKHKRRQPGAADADEFPFAVEDADVVRQALEYPGNVAQTIAGADTDLCSGLLLYVRSRVAVSGATDDGAQRVATIHEFTAKAISRPEVS